MKLSELAILIFVYAIANVVFALLCIVTFVFGYSAFSLVYAIPVWIIVTILLFYSKRLNMLRTQSSMFGAVVGLLPALYFWLAPFILPNSLHHAPPSSEMAGLFPIIVIPPVFLSIASAVFASTMAYRNWTFGIK